MFGWLRQSKTGLQAGTNEVIPLDLSAIPGAFQELDGLPRPQWEVIAPAADALAARFGGHRVWCEVQRQWLEALVAALGADDDGNTYRIIETQSVMTLTAPWDYDDAASLARLCQNTRDAVREIAGGDDEQRGKLPVFIFDSPETYYTYISHFYGEGEYGTTSGICIRESAGDVHIATIYTQYALERVLAHEMVHAELDPNVPVWIQEGAAEVISRSVSRAEPLMLDPADVRRQQHHWRKHGLDAFWYGDSFQRADRGQELSYTLAEVMVQNLLSRRRREFGAFLRQADSVDAGAAAAMQHLGFGLGELAELFLGEGDWAPRAAEGHEPGEARDPTGRR